jgi:hypothetical protein
VGSTKADEQSDGEGEQQEGFDKMEETEEEERAPSPVRIVLCDSVNPCLSITHPHNYVHASKILIDTTKHYMGSTVSTMYLQNKLDGHAIALTYPAVTGWNLRVRNNDCILVGHSVLAQ